MKKVCPSLQALGLSKYLEQYLGIALIQNMHLPYIVHQIVVVFHIAFIQQVSLCISRQIFDILYKLSIFIILCLGYTVILSYWEKLCCLTLNCFLHFSYFTDNNLHMQVYYVSTENELLIRSFNHKSAGLIKLHSQLFDL